MKIALFAYSRQGAQTAQRAAQCFSQEDLRLFLPERFSLPGFEPIQKPASAFYGNWFSWADVMIFVGACGIAVREIAPHVKDKRTDPAVLVLDERAAFIISLLSGHIGGANALTRTLASFLGATPVVTTATDVNRKFSVDTWAAQQGFLIDDMTMAKRVSATILEENVGFYSAFPVVSPYPNGLIPSEGETVGICVSWEERTPFPQTLRLIPPILHLGIGCRRNTGVDTIRAGVAQVFQQHHIDRRAVKCVASIDLKADEEGLLSFCQENQWPVSFYTAEALQQVTGDVSPSSFVQSVTGVDNVCERSALLGADHLVVKKTAINGVTIAVAAEYLEVHFG